jgi:hypothetical protein
MSVATPAVLRRRLAAAVLATATIVIAGVVPALAADRADVTPALVPKAELPLAPESEINVSYAPDVPPASGRTEPALVEVEFEVVENVTAIDPATGVEYETWGYRLPGDAGEVSGTPGPMIPTTWTSTRSPGRAVAQPTPWSRRA